jgi:hypothetical protein
VRNAVFSQVVAYAPTAVPLVAQEMAGPGARPAWARAADLDLREYLLELGAVVDVAVREDEAERAAVAIAREVDSGGAVHGLAR